MRDIVLTAVILGSLPFCFKRPWFGVLMWIIISVMNPHRLAWGFAFDQPFAMLIAIATLSGLIFTKDRRYFPLSPVTVTLLFFILWMNVTTVFALQPEQAQEEWLRVMKTMLMTLVMLTVVYKREHIEWAVLAVVVSIGFYGVKGGIFTLMGGGENRVFGPYGSYIEDNNTLATALVMVIPLMWYVRLRATRKWVRLAILAAMLLTAASAIGSYSRGALLTIVVMAAFLWWKSSNKAVLGIIMFAAAPLLIFTLPEKWFARMDTITNYQEDISALGRLNAWEMAINLAKDRPLVGGGFQIYDPAIFQRYAPDPQDVHAAHSIYFAVLGEHGFVGLALFLLLWFFTWTTGNWIVRRAKGDPNLAWASDLARMCQVSLVGYAVGGAFLSLAYYDVPYYILAVLVLVRSHVSALDSSRNAVDTRTYVGGSTRPSPAPATVRQDS